MSDFDRNKFLQANQRVKEKYPGLQPIPEGIYIATLDDASINKAKTSGRQQASFVWKIDPPDELQGRSIYNHIGLEEEIGYEILNIVLSTLGVRDLPNFIENIDQNLQFLCGRTKARLKIEEKDGFQQVRIKKLLESAFNETSIPETKQVQVPNVANAPPSAPNDLTSKYPKGANVTVKRPDGEYLAEIVNFNPALNKIFVKYKDEAHGSGLVDISQIVHVFGADELQPISSTVSPEVAEEIVEEIVEEVSVKVGMNVKLNYQGRDVIGTIQELLESDGKVKVKGTDPADNKTKIFTVSLDKISLIS
jgi:hypothetical protein